MYVALRARFFREQGFIDIPLSLCVLPIITSPNSEIGALHPPKAKTALFAQKPRRCLKIDDVPIGKGFFRQTRRFGAEIQGLTFQAV